MDYAKESLRLHYQTALLYGEPVKFAATLMNLSRTMAENWADVDPTAQLTVVLENLGIISREEQLLSNLEETLSNAVTTNGNNEDTNWI